MPSTSRALARNNNRPWFNANKDRYLAELRDPLLRFIAAFAPRLKKIHPGMVADPSPAGGSLFRIYRDTRFAKDKSPYKTQAGMFFAFPGGRESPAPGFYLHVAPGEVFMGAGIWHPQPDALKQIRDDGFTRRLKKSRTGRAARRRRKPRARRAATTPSTCDRGPEAQEPPRPQLHRDPSGANDFADRYAAACKDAVPLMKFLTGAVGQRW